jgi:hypothetical protein
LSCDIWALHYPGAGRGAIAAGAMRIDLIAQISDAAHSRVPSGAGL